MLNLIKKKIEKLKSKRSLHEYGFQFKSFHLPQDGAVDYAQWLHPYEGPKTISQSMVNFYRKYAPEGSLVIDIGAHTGDTAVPMAVAVGKSGTVLALEPNPYVFKILLENASLNGEKTTIVPLDFAATDTDGEFEFHYSDASYCNGGFLDKIQSKNHGHHHTLKVKGRNLEKFLLANYAAILGTLSLVKVDAEGYDKEILKSIRPILVKYKPHIISECNKNLTAQERTELFDLLKDMGYKLYKLDGFEENDRTIRIASSSEMSTWKHFDLIATSE